MEPWYRELLLLIGLASLTAGIIANKGFAVGALFLGVALLGRVLIGIKDDE